MVKRIFFEWWSKSGGQKVVVKKWWSKSDGQKVVKSGGQRADVRHSAIENSLERSKAAKALKSDQIAVVQQNSGCGVVKKRWSNGVVKTAVDRRGRLDTSWA